MRLRHSAELSFCIFAIFMAGAPSAQSIFANGFEIPCSNIDADGDRLSGCQELLVATDETLADTDGDGIGDGDELLGTVDGLNLPAMGVNPLRKDILLEYDWFVDANEAGSNEDCPEGLHSHRPSQAALDYVTVMFAAAPVANPDGTTGINIIHDVGQGGVFSGGDVVVDVDDDGIVQGSVSDSDYDSYYAADFALNRRGYFHYVLMPHRFIAADGKDIYSGVAELAEGVMRDEMIVSLYCFRSDRNIGFTIAHELGHNLGLRHGGDTDCNFKPNYNSVMNYEFQFAGVDVDCDGEVFFGPPDYSRGQRLPLDETALNEALGTCGTEAINWNGVSGIEASVEYDINWEDSNQAINCSGVLTTLHDFDDWSNIAIDMTLLGTEVGNEPPEAALLPPLCPPPPEALP